MMWKILFVVKLKILMKRGFWLRNKSVRVMSFGSNAFIVIFEFFVCRCCLSLYMKSMFVNLEFLYVLLVLNVLLFVILNVVLSRSRFRKSSMCASLFIDFFGDVGSCILFVVMMICGCVLFDFLRFFNNKLVSKKCFKWFILNVFSKSFFVRCITGSSLYFTSAFRYKVLILFVFFILCMKVCIEFKFDKLYLMYLMFVLFVFVVDNIFVLVVFVFARVRYVNTTI